MEVHQIRSCDALCSYLDKGGRAKYLMFWGHSAGKGNALTRACFSQWYGARFTLDGVAYPTAEHFMMAEKARLFGDAVALERVLLAGGPGAAKAAGRSVLGFKEEIWLAHRWDIVLRAIAAKFGQDPQLRDFLLETGKRVLVEASPVDSIWGIGLAADDDNAERPRAWKGLNLLGFALMEVRERLVRQA
jgi:ribA/ribD-fused uncharacterized protein